MHCKVPVLQYQTVARVHMNNGKVLILGANLLLKWGVVGAQ